MPRLREDDPERLGLVLHLRLGAREVVMRGEYAGHRCAHLGCARDAQSLGLCGAHYMRQKRGTAMDRPIMAQRPRTLAEQLRDAAIAYAEAESMREFDAAWARLRAAAKAYTFGEAA